MMNLSFKLAIATLITLPFTLATSHPATSTLETASGIQIAQRDLPELGIPEIKIPQVKVPGDRALTETQLKLGLQPYIEGYAELVYQNYQDSHQQAQVMAQAISQFLAEPNASTHAAAQQAWVEARQSYLQTEAFRFYEGPIDFVDAATGEEGPEGRINAWPMNEAFIDYVKGNPNSGIINNKSLDVSLKTIVENDQVSDEADVTTGWHAIEFLLWGQDFNPNGPGQRSYEDFVADQGNNNRRRAYLNLVTQQLLEDLSFLENEWQPNANNYRAGFVQQDPKETLGKIFTSLATLSAFEMSSERIAVALDSGNQEDGTVFQESDC